MLKIILKIRSYKNFIFFEAEFCFSSVPLFFGGLTSDVCKNHPNCRKMKVIKYGNNVTEYKITYCESLFFHKNNGERISTIR